MSEIDSSLEISKIPENWKFSGRGNPNIKVMQIDINERFLSYQRNVNLQEANVSNPLYGYEEIFFSENGKEVASRSHQKIEMYIGFWGGELPITYVLPVGAPEPYSSSLSVHFTGGSLGGSIYDRGILRLASLGRDFTTEDLSGSDIRAPRLMFGSVQTTRPDEKRKYDLNKEVSDSSDFIIKEDEDKENEATIFSNGGEEVFKVARRIQEQEREEPPCLVVSQTHILSGIEKTVRTPLNMDYEKVVEASHSKPPYRKVGLGRIIGGGRLEVPWRNIDRIVGASLSYSYPPPTQNSSY